MCLIGVCAAAVYNIQPENRDFVVVPQEKISDDDLNVAESAQFGYGGYGGYGGYPYGGGYGGYGGKRAIFV